MSELNTQEIPSPCTHNCMLNSQHICTGCYRTNDEIGDWCVFDNATKMKIIIDAKERKANRFK